eukprot:COSAG01_NODE_9949_length_2294_cov_3.324829_2_plen_391_part_00
MSPRPLRGGAEAGGVSSNTVHVRGVGGALEDVEALKALFARCGTVLRAKVRHRIDATSGLNTSWALVQMWSPSEAECALRQKFQSPEGRTLEVTRFDQEQADRSVGGMRWTAQQLPDYSYRRMDVRCDVTAMAQRVFTELDTDTDGYLTSSQVEMATRKLQLVELRGHGSRHKWYWQMLDMEKALCLRKQTPSSVAAAVSEDGTATERQEVKQNHVSRETFVCWVKLYHDKLKQLTVEAAEKLFALLDQDDSGTLDRYEVERERERERERWVCQRPAHRPLPLPTLGHCSVDRSSHAATPPHACCRGAAGGPWTADGAGSCGARWGSSVTKEASKHERQASHLQCDARLGAPADRGGVASQSHAELGDLERAQPCPAVSVINFVIRTGVT